MDDTRNEVCCKVLETPLWEIRKDVFFRADNFQDEPWYGEFLFYRRLGVCRPKLEHTLEAQKALKVMGYPTHTVEKDRLLYLHPGEKANPLWMEMKIERLEKRTKAVSLSFQKFSRQKGWER